MKHLPKTIEELETWHLVPKKKSYNIESWLLVAFLVGSIWACFDVLKSIQDAKIHENVYSIVKNR